jgi:hypothetical protein
LGAQTDRDVQLGLEVLAHDICVATDLPPASRVTDPASKSRFAAADPRREC